MESKTHFFKVTGDDAGKRLDRFLSELLPSLSRMAVQNAIKSGNVKVSFANKRGKIKPSYILETGDEVTIAVPRINDDNKIKPEDIPLRVEYEDDDMLIINKPIGISVHPGAGIKSGTIANAVRFLLQENLSSTAGEERPGIVHRIDKDTSGLLIIAKNNTAHHRLSSMFERRLIKKEYLAITTGIFEFDEDRIDAPIERDPIHREKFRIGYGPGCRQAQTDYKAIKRLADENKTIALFMPLTGRTHQLRVHSRHIGHPIVGDKKYNTTKDRNYPRLCLHAFRMRFKHPMTGANLEIKTDIPDFLKPYSKDITSARI